MTDFVKFLILSFYHTIDFFDYLSYLNVRFHFFIFFCLCVCVFTCFHCLFKVSFVFLKYLLFYLFVEFMLTVWYDVYLFHFNNTDKLEHSLIVLII